MGAINRIFDLLEVVGHNFGQGVPVFFGKKDGVLYTIDAATYQRKSYLLAFALMESGIKPGDKIAVVINNRPEWNIVDMAIMLAGAVQVPIYPNISLEQFQFIFNDSAISAIILNDEALWQKLHPLFEFTPSLHTVITLNKVPSVMDIEAFLKKHEESFDKLKVEAVAAHITSSDLFAIIYTSGTTGAPKGVMLSHCNVISNFLALTLILAQQSARRAVSLLPLCHIYERILNYTYQNSGTAIWYVDGFDKLREELQQAQPEIFCAVPRLIEKLYDSIMAKGRELKGIKRFIFGQAIEAARQFEPGKENSIYVLLKLELARRLVFKHWHEALGGSLVTIVSGGAPLNPKIARIFWAAGFKIMEGYGLTETSPVIAVGNFLKNGVRMGTVGPILPGVEVAFANDGEILVRGPNVMMGYYNRPERTAEALDQAGWFHTGDIGAMVESRFLKITDRKKEIFKTSGGKYIAPQIIENLFKASSFIEHIMVVGENRKHPAAIIVPDFTYLQSWCDVKEIPYFSDAEMIEDERIKRRLEREVSSLNHHLGRFEQIKKWKIVADNWSVETGELSPTLKLRRKFLLEKYKDLIEAIYERP